jgi:hypothetical protein
LESITYESNKGIEDFINCISRKVTEIKGLRGLIADVIVSGFLIRSIPNKEYVNYKPFIGSIKDNLPRLKMELYKAEASIKEEKLRANSSNTSNSILKVLSAGGNQSRKHSNKD